MKKWSMHSPESVLENETETQLWDFEIHTDHLFSAKRLDLKIIYKKKENLPNCWLCYSQRKIESKQKESKKKQKAKKIIVGQENDGDTSCI